MTFQEYRQKLIKLGKAIHRAYWEGRSKVVDRLERSRMDLIESFPEYSEE